MSFDQEIFDPGNTEVEFVFEKPDGTPYSRRNWATNGQCIPAGGVWAEVWFSYDDDCNNLPASAGREACRLHLKVSPEAKPGAYSLSFLQGGFQLVYDRLLPRDRPEGLSFRQGTIFVLPEQQIFRRGDANNDGQMDISDVILSLNMMFLGASPSPCPDARDTNDDGQVDVSDAVIALEALFLGGNSLPPPGPQACGTDPADDSLGVCFYDPGRC